MVEIRSESLRDSQFLGQKIQFLSGAWARGLGVAWLQCPPPISDISPAALAASRRGDPGGLLGLPPAGKWPGNF